MSHDVVRIDPVEWLRTFEIASLPYQLQHRNLSLEYRIARSLTEKPYGEKQMFAKLDQLSERNNLYTGNIPYHDNIVTIPSNKFINASWVANNLYEKSFIVSQAPILDNQDEFCEMLSYYKVKCIICLASKNDHYNCERYHEQNFVHNKYEILSKQSSHLTFMDIIKLSKNDAIVKRDIGLKQAAVSSKKNVFKTKHVHFNKWNDMDIANPEDICELVEFAIQQKNAHPYHPILVHCIAGVGRAGTLVLILIICIDVANRYKAGERDICVSIIDTLVRIRSQRPNLVATCEQYKLVYETVNCFYLRLTNQK